jgi:hypothetical protein
MVWLEAKDSGYKLRIEFKEEIYRSVLRIKLKDKFEGQGLRLTFIIEV